MTIPPLGWLPADCPARFAVDQDSMVEAPETTPEHDRSSPTWVEDWERILSRYVGDEDPWALAGLRPDGDVRLFGTDPAGIRACAEYAVAVWALRPQRD